jgi:hypothetical protein
MAGTPGRRATAADRDGIDRDALLRSVFPEGMPAREDVIRAVTAWVDEAERLVHMRSRFLVEQAFDQTR